MLHTPFPGAHCRNRWIGSGCAEIVRHVSARGARRGIGVLENLRRNDSLEPRVKPRRDDRSALAIPGFNPGRHLGVHRVYDSGSFRCLLPLRGRKSLDRARRYA